MPAIQGRQRRWTAVLGLDYTGIRLSFGSILNGSTFQLNIWLHSEVAQIIFFFFLLAHVTQICFYITI